MNTDRNGTNEYFKVYRDDKTTIDFRKMKATYLPFNRRVYIPSPLEEHNKLLLQVLKQELVDISNKYVRDRNNGKVSRNISKEQELGMKSLIEKSKKGDIVIQCTDKSGRQSVDTPENYIMATEEHIKNDIILTERDHESAEKLINAHSMSWARMLNMGKDTNSYNRIRSNLMSHNSAYATLSNLRKDHKPSPDPILGPPGRPLCGANVAFNRRLSHILSILLVDSVENEETECGNTEELIAEFERMNINGVSEEFIIGSMDVKAMYPSLDIPLTVEKVCEVFQNSDVEIKGVDYHEVGLYIALNKTQEEIDEMGIGNLCPKRKRYRGPKPTITGSGMKENDKERHDPWKFPDIGRMTEIEKKYILTQAVSIGLMTVMTSHIYEFNGSLRRQKNGGAIGMELTGTLAKVFMIWWDKMFLNKLTELNIRMPIYKRYVDDINCGGEFVNGVYDGTSITLSNRTADEINTKDKITMELMKTIGDTIHKSIQLEIEYPSKFCDNKLPILDLKVWVQKVGGKRIIMYEHYKKEVSSKAMVLANSAIPMKQKRTIITQEILRIMTHCSRSLVKEVTNSHINEAMRRIQ